MPNPPKVIWSDEMLAFATELWLAKVSGQKIADECKARWPGPATAQMTRFSAHNKLHESAPRARIRQPREKKHEPGKPFERVRRDEDETKPYFSLDLTDLLSPETRERAEIVMAWKLDGNEGLMTADMITAVQMERRQKRAA